MAYGGLVGWWGGYSIGGRLTRAVESGREIRQGENRLLASGATLPALSALATACSVLTDRVLTHHPSYRSWKIPLTILYNVAPLALTSVALLSAISARGGYEKVSHACVFLPKTLSPRQTKALEFVDRHIHTAIRIAMVVTSIALLRWGPVAVTVGFVVAPVYAWLNKEKFIPDRVAQFVERWQCCITAVGGICIGPRFSRLISLVNAAMCISSAFSRVMLREWDRRVGSWTNRIIDGKLIALNVSVQSLSGPKLEVGFADIMEDHHWVSPREVTKEEMEGIIQAFEEARRNPSGDEAACIAKAFNGALTIAPPSLFRKVEFSLPFSSNTESALCERLFEEEYLPLLGSLCNQNAGFGVPQSEKVVGDAFLEKEWKVIWYALHDDERFRHRLYDQTKGLEEEVRQRLRAGTLQREQFFDVLRQNAEQAHTTVTKVGCNWVREGWEHLVGVLNGQKESPGSAEKLLTCRAFMDQIRGYLAWLKNQGDKQEIRSVLLQLAVQGGGYCLDGVLTCLNNLVLNMRFLPACQQGEQKSEIEDVFFRQWYISRGKSVEEVLAFMAKECKEYGSQVLDVHVANQIMRTLRFGLGLEQASPDFIDWGLWMMYRPIRRILELSLFTQLSQVMESNEVGMARITAYVRTKVRENRQFPADYKALLETQLGSGELTPLNYQYLALFFMGVLLIPVFPEAGASLPEAL